MNNRLGIFDSGVGGLSVLKSIRARHSNFDAIYLADTLRSPFGSKSSAEIRQIAIEITQWLTLQKIDAIIVACNTTNSLALDIVKENSDVPVFDLIGSVSEIIQESRVGVLATPSTVESKAYTKSIKASNPCCYVKEEGCPEFVPMIESGMIDSSELKESIVHHLTPLLNAKVNSIVLQFKPC